MLYEQNFKHVSLGSLTIWINNESIILARSHGLVVKGEDLQPKGCGFEPQCQISIWNVNEALAITFKKDK